MKRIIDGVAYNTDTATIVATMEYDDTGVGGPRGTVTLYQTRGGAFFLHDRETLPYRDRSGEWQERTRDLVDPQTRGKAQEWVMTTGVDLHSDVFGEVPEAAAESVPSSTLYIRLPTSLKERLETAARDEGASLNAWTVRCAEKCMQMDEVGRALGGIISTGLCLSSEPGDLIYREQDVREMVEHMSDIATHVAKLLGWNGKELENLSTDAGGGAYHRAWELTEKLAA